MKILVTGGIKSGKSVFAEKKTLELSKGQIPVYLATAERNDQEMERKIEKHRRQRMNRFRTIEEPLQIVSALDQDTAPALVECMTLWLNNWLHYQKDEDEIPGIVQQLLELPRDLVLVINEVGQGIIPENPLARKFAEWSGRVASGLGSGCEEIWYCVAGHPMRVK